MRKHIKLFQTDGPGCRGEFCQSSPAAVSAREFSKRHCLSAREGVRTCIMESELSIGRREKGDGRHGELLLAGANFSPAAAILVIRHTRRGCGIGRRRGVRTRWPNCMSEFLHRDAYRVLITCGKVLRKNIPFHPLCKPSLPPSAERRDDEKATFLPATD